MTFAQENRTFFVLDFFCTHGCMVFGAKFAVRQSAAPAMQKFERPTAKWLSSLIGGQVWPDLGSFRVMSCFGLREKTPCGQQHFAARAIATILEVLPIYLRHARKSKKRFLLPGARYRRRPSSCYLLFIGRRNLN